MISHKPIFLKSIYRARDQSYKSFKRRKASQSTEAEEKKIARKKNKKKLQKKAKIYVVQM